MPRYELSSRKPPRFWEIHVVGAEYTLREGAVGTAGKESTITEVSHDAALEAAAMLIESRRKRGYLLVSGTEPTAEPAPDPPADAALEGPDSADPAAAPAVAEHSPFIPQNLALEQVIHGDPTDAAGYLVYGDWLQTQGHPWGELIAVQHALEREPDAENADSLRATEAAFLRKYELPLLGALARHSQVKLSFRLGFIAGARVNEGTWTNAASLRALVRALQRLPAARFLNDLWVGTLTHYVKGDYGPVTAQLTARKAPQALRRLSLGMSALHDNSLMGAEIPPAKGVASGGAAWPLLGDLEALFNAFPKLEDVTLQTSDVHLGTIRLPELRAFELRSQTWARGIIHSLVTAEWPKLERLDLWFGRPLEPADEQAVLAPLLSCLDAGGMPALRHLGLRCTSSTRAICESLSRSRTLKQLESLDLWMGSLDDEGARTIARAAGAFAHLDVFNLENNLLTPESFHSLAGLMHCVWLGGQRKS
jgi:uncharacterized protein (TIGR02996 family)